MRNADISTKVTTSRVTFVMGIGALVGGMAIVGVLIGAPRYAQAKPEYAAQEGKPCGYCHVSPAGGGPRNAMGKQYEANGHKFKK